MTDTLTTSDPQKHLRRRRCWLVPVVLVALLLVLVIGLAALTVFSNSLSISEANAILDRLEKKVDIVEGTRQIYKIRCTLEELESLLGKPHGTGIGAEGKSYGWMFTKHHATTIEYLQVSATTRVDNVTTHLAYHEGTMTGRDAWEFRWELLKRRLGWK